MRAQAYQQFTLAQVTDIVEGRSAGARSSLNKVFWSELDIALHETALELLGPEGQTDNPWSRGFQFSLSGPIYAGTNEIQRNIIAERLLGLPRK
jgi:alkylation response protein AidB-like acyl-CoA dehydrogenase